MSKAVKVMEIQTVLVTWRVVVMDNI